MSIFYRQCTLERRLTNSTISQVAWIPEQHAVLDGDVQIKYGRTWTPGWVVRTVSATRLAEDQLPYPPRSIREHRKRTGDALPKQPVQR